MSNRFVNPIPQFIDSNSSVIAGGKLTFYEVNTDTLLVLYGDSDLSITITNPVELGDKGEVPNIFYEADARVVLTDALDNQIFDVQPVSSTGGGTGGVSGWLSSVTYPQLSIVYGSDGLFYISLVNDNSGNDPTSDTNNSASWSQIDFIHVYNTQEVYQQGDIVLANGTLYTSLISDNVGNTPQNDISNWINLYDSTRVTFDNTVSGLLATNAKTAIDELKAIIDAIAQPLLYKGVIDLTAGDSALPPSPTIGDLYVVGVSGDITVSTNGGAPALTTVAVGSRVVYNGTNWDLLPISDTASTIGYSNLTSGLTATDVQSAIDEVELRVENNESDIAGINNTLASIGSGVTYKGTLDVSGGDASLPSLVVGGDLYGIRVGGTITVSVSGAVPALTAVTEGQQIVYNDFLTQWELLSSPNSAGLISYQNTTSNLTAVNVQDAIDEIDSSVDTLQTSVTALEANDSISLQTSNVDTTINKTANITDVSKIDTSNVVYTVNDTQFASGDLIRIRKTNQVGSLTISTTNNQVAPDGTLDTSSQFPDGSSGSVELQFNGSQWALRVY